MEIKGLFKAALHKIKCVLLNVTKASSNVHKTGACLHGLSAEILQCPLSLNVPACPRSGLGPRARGALPLKQRPCPAGSIPRAVTSSLRHTQIKTRYSCLKRAARLRDQQPAHHRRSFNSQTLTALLLSLLVDPTKLSHCFVFVRQPQMR